MADAASSSGIYGGIPGNSSYPASGYAGGPPVASLERRIALRRWAWDGAAPYGGGRWRLRERRVWQAAVTVRRPGGYPAGVSAQPCIPSGGYSGPSDGSRGGAGNRDTDDTRRRGRFRRSSGSGGPDRLLSFVVARNWQTGRAADRPEPFRQYASRAGHAAGVGTDPASARTAGRSAAPGTDRRQDL